MEKPRKVPVWRLTSTEGDWTLARAKDFIRSEENSLSDHQLHHSMPSMAHLLCKALPCSKDKGYCRERMIQDNTPTILDAVPFKHDNLELPISAERDGNPQGLHEMGVAGVDANHTHPFNLSVPTVSHQTYCLVSSGRQNTSPTPGTEHLLLRPASKHLECDKCICNSNASNQGQAIRLASYNHEIPTGGSESASMFQTAEGKPLGLPSFACKKGCAILSEERPPEHNSNVQTLTAVAGTDTFMSSASMEEAEPRDFECTGSGELDSHHMPPCKISIDDMATLKAKSSKEKMVTEQAVATTNSLTSKTEQLHASEMSELCKWQNIENNTYRMYKSGKDPTCTTSHSLAIVNEDYMLQCQSSFPSMGTHALGSFQLTSEKPVAISPTSNQKRQTMLKEGFSPECHSSMHLNEKAKVKTEAINKMTVEPSYVEKVSASSPQVLMSRVDDFDNRLMGSGIVSNAPTCSLGENMATEIIGDTKNGSQYYKTIVTPSWQPLASSSRIQSSADGDTIQSDEALAFGYEKGEAASMFRTASGKSVKLSLSSLQRACTILDDDRSSVMTPKKQQNGIKALAIPDSDVEAANVWGHNETFSVTQTSLSSTKNFWCKPVPNVEQDALSNKNGFHEDISSMFQTAAGKPVSLSTSSMQRAYSLLSDDSTLNSFIDSLSNRRNQHQNEKKMLKTPVHGTETVREVVNCKVPRTCINSMSLPSIFTNNSSARTCVEESNIANTNLTLENNITASMFQTATGDPLAISFSSLQRAQSIFINESEANVIPKDISSNVFQMQENIGALQKLCGTEESIYKKNKMEKIPMKAFDELEKKNKVNNEIENGNASNPMTYMIGKTNTCDIPGVVGNVSSEAMKRAMGLLGLCPDNDFACLNSASSTREQGIPPVALPVMFQTAGGKSVCVTDDAIKRARNLLSDVEITSNNVIDQSSNKENLCDPKLSDVGSMAPSGGSELQLNANGPKRLGKRKNHARPLLEVSNTKPAFMSDLHPQHRNKLSKTHKMFPSIKKGSNIQKFITPFKQPRRSSFISPYEKNNASTGFNSDAQVESSALGASSDIRFQFSFPSSKTRKTLHEFFVHSPHHIATWLLSREVQSMTADNAATYKFPKDQCLLDHSMGFQDFQHLLFGCGADRQFATSEWVQNHYKWIVWKLACIERSYADKAAGKYLTVQNVLEELKYRYEREINRGHRSPIKRIVEGDAAPGHMMVLCVSAVRSLPKGITYASSSKEGKEGSNYLDNNEVTAKSKSNLAKIEVTDGWYCLNAVLDELLSKQLESSKIFIGQKLRVCGARLGGWSGPLTPLEALQSVNLLLHINGTYRAHWAERLSFCQGVPTPLAFRCIKEGGGTVPRTLVVVNRIYPTLYMERYKDGGYMVRSARAQDKRLLLYNERRANIVEEVVTIMENEFDSSKISNEDKEEGAQLYKILENAAEPELLMADMTSAQLAAFSAYKRKREADRQASLEKHIQKALEDANLENNEIIPFARIRVSGLRNKGNEINYHSMGKNKFAKQDGLVTIWRSPDNPALDLEEGALYSVSGLVALAGKSNDNYGENVIRLQANRNTVWSRLPQSAYGMFQYSYTPRSVVPLSDMGKLSMNSEFDCAVFILHVEEPYLCGFRKRQWLFVSDGTVEESCEQSETVLAIDYSFPQDAFIPFDSSLVGSTVGFCNLVKKKRDQNRGLWVAEMTDNSIHCLNFGTPSFSHLKLAAASVDNWAKNLVQSVDKLYERVLSIVKKGE